LCYQQPYACLMDPGIYARTSTLEQVAGFETQKRELQQLGCTKIFAEQVSSVAERAELDRAIDFIREGDCSNQD